MLCTNNKGKYFALFGIFILIWFYNNCFPLIWDDFIYSYIIEDDLFNPLPGNTHRVNGFKDILQSQWNHYFCWGGRTVAHTLAQFFLWQGKCIFNVVNALCFVFLLLEIQWIIEGGRISFDFSVKDFLWIFNMFWIFSVLLNDVLTWLTLSANYLWTLVLLLFFLVFYIRIFFSPGENTNYADNHLLTFLFGLVTGWTNENTVCFIIVLLGYYIYLVKRRKKFFCVSDTELSKLLPGFVGLVLGYLLLLFSPGNYVRYISLLQNGAINSGLPLLKENLKTFALIFIIRFLLFYYIFRNLFLLRTLFSKLKEVNKKQFIISVVFLYLSIGSLAIMILSPEFRIRSGFASLVFSLISAGIVRKLKLLGRDYCSKKDTRDNVKKLIDYIVLAYVCFTLFCSTYVYYMTRQQNDIMLEQILYEKRKPTGQVLIVKECPDIITKDLLFWFVVTGGHVPNTRTLTSDADYWINRYVALYYGIPAIKTE